MLIEVCAAHCFWTWDSTGTLKEQTVLCQVTVLGPARVALSHIFTAGSMYLERNSKIPLPFGSRYFLTSKYTEFFIVTRI